MIWDLCNLRKTVHKQRSEKHAHFKQRLDRCERLRGKTVWKCSSLLPFERWSYTRSRAELLMYKTHYVDPLKTYRPHLWTGSEPTSWDILHNKKVKYVYISLPTTRSWRASPGWNCEVCQDGRVITAAVPLASPSAVNTRKPFNFLSPISLWKLFSDALNNTLKSTQSQNSSRQRVSPLLAKYVYTYKEQK